MLVPWLSYLKSFMGRPSHIADLLPWDRMVDDCVALMKDSGLLMVWRVVPRDLSGMTDIEQGNLMLALNRALLRLEPGWVLWHDAQHVQAPAEAPATFGHETAQLIDGAQRAQAERESRWVTQQYLSFWYKPVDTSTAPLQRVLFTGAHQAMGSDLNTRVAAFRTAVEQCADLLGVGCRSIEPLTTDDLYTYLHNLISDSPHEVIAESPYLDMSYQLADTEVWGGLAPQLGSLRLGVLSLKNFPATTRANMFGALEALPFPYRWVTRSAPISQEQADRTFMDMQIDIKGNTKSYKAFAYELIYSGKAAVKDRHAERQVDDADTARDEVLSDELGYGELTHTMILPAPSDVALAQAMRQVLKILRGQGAVVVQERLNAFEAWLGTLPGLPQANVRRYKLSTLNALHLSAWHAPDLGVSWVPKLAGAPLTIEKTEGCQPYGFTNYVEDVGHMRVIGRTGSGKSAGVNYLASRSLRYPGAQVFLIDFYKRSARCMVLCHGGRYYDFGRETIGLQPLARIDEPAERVWALTWLRAIMDDAKLTLTTTVQNYLDGGLVALASVPRAQRTLSALVVALGQISRQLELNTANYLKAEKKAALTIHKEVIAAILPFTKGHVYGHILDADHDDLSQDQVSGFALESLLNTPLLLGPVSTCLWHALYQRFTGVPTWLVMDEVSFALRIALLRQQIDEALRVLREYTVSLVLCTQNPLDMLDSDIAPVLNNCLTSLLLPNADATSDAVRPAYDALGLNAAQIAQLASATPKRDYFVVQEQRSRLMTMRLTPLAQAICGSSSPEDHALMDHVFAEYGPEAFRQHWLEAKGIDAATTMRR